MNVHSLHHSDATDPGYTWGRWSSQKIEQCANQKDRVHTRETTRMCNMRGGQPDNEGKWTGCYLDDEQTMSTEYLCG